MPLPSTQLFHPSWAARVAPVNASAFNVELTLTVPTDSGDGGWSSGGGPSTGGTEELYSGPARVTYEATQGTDGDAAGQEVSSRRVQVTLPRSAGVAEGINGARIEITDVLDPNAPEALLGRIMIVETASLSSHTWELVLDAVDDQTNQP